MGIITKYKFNQNIHENYLPIFNDDFTDYTITDEIDTDGFTVRTIESDDLPTSIRFGSSTSAYESIGVLSLLKIDYVNIHNGIKSLDNFLANARNLISVNTNGWDTSNITDMYAMFYYCYSLISLDLSNFDTSNVTNMNSTFNGCSKLTSLDVSKFNTSQVTNMSNMFHGCSLLTSLDVSSFNTSNVISMDRMFYDCQSLTLLDVSNFNTSQVTTMEGMFLNCSSLTSLDISNFNTENVTIMQNMFQNCSSLISLDVSNFNTKKVTNMYCMFLNCSSLTSLDISNFNTENVTNMQGIFADCSSLISLDISSFNTEKITNMQGMFQNCSSLTSLDVSNFNTKNVTNIQGIFYNCSSLISLDVSNFDTSQVTTMSNMFTYCSKLIDIGVIYCNSSTINKISSLITTNTKIYYSLPDISELEPYDNIEYIKYIFPTKIQLPPHIQLHSLPDGTCDELDIKTGILTRRIDENYNLLEEEITEKLILNYNNSCNYGVILPRGTSDNYNVTTNEYKQNLDFIPIDDSIAFDTATLKDTTVKFSVALSKFEVDTTNVRGSDGIYCDNNLFKYETSDNDYEHAYIENDTTLHIYVNKSRLNSYDQVGFQLYLSGNPFNVYYAMRTPIISYVNYEDLDPEKASWEMLDCTEDGSITIESGEMDKTLLLDCMDYVAPTKNRFEIDLLKPNTQYTIYAEGVNGRVQLNFGGNTVNFTSGNIYTSGETQLVEFYTDNEIKNLIVIEGDTRNETIEFFEGVTSSKNITVISSNSDENESNKISYDGITLRSLPNGVKDEINVLTGEYIQRIEEFVFNGSDGEMWELFSTGDYSTTPFIYINLSGLSNGDSYTNKYSLASKISADGELGYCLYYNGIINGITQTVLRVRTKEILFGQTIKEWKNELQANPLILQYQLEKPIIRQLDPQSLTPYQDGYISMETEVNYPSFIYSLPSTNTFYIPKIKNMTQYTLKYPVGSGTVTIGNIQYNVTSDSMLFTTPIEITGDKNSFVFETDDNPTEVMILEGNYSDREVKYFTGINSVINPIIRVINSLTGGSVEYKGNSDIALYSLPNKMSDKLDILTGYLMRVTGIREYQDGDYELDNVFTDGINTVYKLDSPLLYRNINFPVPTLNGYGMIELDSDEAIPQFNYRVLSNNYYPIELLEPNTTYTMIGEAQANTTFALGGTYVGNYNGGKLVVNLGSVTEKSLKFSNDIGLKNFMLVKGDATNSVLPFYTGIKSVEDISFLIKGYDGQENNLVLDDSIVLRECGGIYDSIDLINYTMTKRLNEIVLVGTEYWSVETSKQVDSDYQLFSLAVTSAKDTKNAKIYCDKLIHKYLGNNTDCVYFENNKLYLCINKHTIGGDNINALKVWLTKNNVKIIYPLINDVKLDLDVVWEITPPTSYETQTEFSSNVALGSLKPMLALTVATTTLEDIVSTLETQNAKLEEENIATMLALTGIYETMVAPTIESGISTINLSDGKDGNNMNGMSISPMGMIYAKLIKKGLKTIEQVPIHLQAEVKYVLKEDK